MTDIALKSHTTQKSSLTQWLRATFDWLRQANVAARLPLESVDDLSDRELRDIGGERRDIARAMDRELREIGLLGTGWQKR
ncbi:hypothetical protein CK228_19640 [Mesorhizobium sp. WSM4312]|uniref:hypothetical protein n=1 Tax=unclassified Mesorhizobium TaxID=325217 RepID=UPI000BAF8000|nr:MULTISPECIES: hypothetical protein [unclassified Mesorhizobium]PBB23759.1 hypothetical protein CK232_25855 [Mesorhizobium sp. WSM4304]PBB66807.1 hypothetical protein CK228_19640 [Mesorhizobium sp. WSM4312]PBB72605.1 hypothetical protein CK227_25555 [Mesorhizobium sp. WSM4308]TRC73799.1 hypothetical protein FJV81_23590 [Mesorhizobium sp. WSM4315]TRC82396.1 hypothetical protein FJV83_22510 [Mesorhizobium sp. WSM4307]